MLSNSCFLSQLNLFSLSRPIYETLQKVQEINYHWNLGNAFSHFGYITANPKQQFSGVFLAWVSISAFPYWWVCNKTSSNFCYEKCIKKAEEISLPDQRLDLYHFFTNICEPFCFTYGWKSFLLVSLKRLLPQTHSNFPSLTYILALCFETDPHIRILHSYKWIGKSHIHQSELGRRAG